MKKIIFLSLLLTTLSSNFVFCQTLQIVMDYYPPFSHKENNEIKGISTQVVNAALKEAGIRASIKQYPFIRAYKMTQKNKDIFEYCVVKTKERTPLFKWVGIVGPATQILFALKDRNIHIEKNEDMKGYRIGVVSEDVVDQYFSARQDKLGIKLDRVASYELNMKKLFKGRFDMWAGNELVGLYLAKKLGYNKEDIEVVYTIDELTDYYYLVTGPKTSDALFQKMHTAFETIHSNGTYQGIIDKYLTY